MPQFTLTCTDEDETVTSKEFEATILNEVVEKTQDFLHGVGSVSYTHLTLPTTPYV